MGQRGRKSAASLVVVKPGAVLARPEPPEDLNPEQAEEWWSVVNRMPADWFPRETHALLAQYCRHVVRARHVGRLIDKYEKRKDVVPKEYNLLLRQETIQSRMLSMLATKMRIAQQSTYDKSKKKPFDERPLPSDFDEDEEADEG